LQPESGQLDTRQFSVKIALRSNEDFDLGGSHGGLVCFGIGKRESAASSHEPLSMPSEAEEIDLADLTKVRRLANRNKPSILSKSHTVSLRKRGL